MREKLEEKFLDILKGTIPTNVLNLGYKENLIKEESQMEIEQDVYSSRCDIAVGPFSFGDGNYNEIYLRLAELPQIKEFITSMKVER